MTTLAMAARSIASVLASFRKGLKLFLDSRLRGNDTCRYADRRKVVIPAKAGIQFSVLCQTKSLRTLLKLAYFQKRFTLLKSLE